MYKAEKNDASMSKKTIFILLAAVLIVAVFAAFAPKAKAAAVLGFEDAYVIGENVNLRLRPTKEAPVVCSFSAGTRVGVFCEETDGWLRVVYGNYRGYISKDFIFVPSSDTMVGHILADGTKIYSDSNQYSKTVGSQNVGSAVTIKGVSGEYYMVEIEKSGEKVKAASSGANGKDENVEIGYIKQSNLKLSTGKKSNDLLKEGMAGVEVEKMQKELKKRGFFGGSTSKYFGEKTKTALEMFQERAGISPDGVAGAKTLQLLYGKNDIRLTVAQRIGIHGNVKLTDWSVIHRGWKVGSTATVTDVGTGISFKVYRHGGHLHADSEPYTAKDTQKMLQCFGGSPSWDRRAVWVTIGGTTYAASMHSYPHGEYTIKNNNYDGHMCIHFLNSRIHKTGNKDPRHQACVQYAYKKGNSK